MAGKAPNGRERRPGPQPITPEFYQAMVLAFTEWPGNINRVTAKLHCSVALAKKGWHYGWPHKAPWARPIKDVIEKDTETVRLKLAEAAEKVREERAKELVTDAQSAAMKREQADLAVEASIAQVRADAAFTLLEEAKMIRVARGNVTGLFVYSQKLLMAAQKMVDKIVAKLESDELESPMDGIKILSRLNNVTQATAITAKNVLEMQRLLLGQPTAIVEQRGKVEIGTDHMSTDEAMKTLAFAASVYSRFDEHIKRSEAIDVDVYQEESSEPQNDAGADPAASPDEPDAT